MSYLAARRALVLALSTAPLAARAQTAQPDTAPAASAPGTPAITGADIVRAARRYLGVPYRLGGSTPRAFDCSGFVRYVFAEYNIALPRTAHEQAALGDAPEPGDLRPGDLLFFYGGYGAQHIAIYVGGDTLIHASSGAHRVKYDRFADGERDWFHRRLIAVRRVLPLQGAVEVAVRPPE